MSRGDARKARTKCVAGGNFRLVQTIKTVTPTAASRLSHVALCFTSIVHGHTIRAPPQHLKLAAIAAERLSDTFTYSGNMVLIAIGTNGSRQNTAVTDCE